MAPTARAQRRGGAIELDGRLVESDWNRAAPVQGLIQTVPLEGRPVSERTEVRILFDSDAIYIGARLEDRSPVTTRLARRDSGLGDSDRFVVLLDSYHDHETAYRFWTNPSGVKGDAIVTGNSTGGGDSSWDPIWDLAVEVDATGWVVEMRIPFSQLRFGGDVQQVWGVQVERNINRNQEVATFPFTPALERAGVSRFAHLEGLEEIDAGRPLELLPYVVGRGEYTRVESPAGVGFTNPYRSGSDYFGGVGLDLKYRLTSNVTLDGTVNPDFGQVELDPSVINLTAFETRYSERRPFFVEGADIFSFGEAGPSGSVGRAPELFYSRRIGGPPTGSAPSNAVFSDVPGQTTILGAAKVTGRVGDGWTLGIMEAATASESAAYLDGTGVPGEATVEPFTNHFVGRVRRQIRGGATRFGMIGTAVNRDITTAELTDRMHSSAYSGGFDFAHESTDRVWLFTGVVAGSRVSGDANALLRTQRSSARYYQRPDADHVELDPTATSLDGFYVMGYVGKQAGSFTMRNGFAYISPGYESNDLGFHSDADRILFDTHYQYNQPNPGRFLRSWSFNASPDAKWNTAGNRIFANVNSQVSLELLNYWRASLRVQFDPWTDDDRLTRGGPMARQPGARDARLSLNSDGRRTVVGNASYRWNRDDAGGWSRSVSVGLNARLRETFRLSMSPSYSWSRSTAQYVRRVDDPLATNTFGARYVFADLERSTVSLDTRLDVTFTPTLSLQLYLEPFISVGDYGALKEFRAPDTFDFLEYGTDVGTVTQAPDGTVDIDPDGGGAAPSFTVGDRDFSYRSLLGNAVLRWEWRPGSTLFLVWQQSRINRVTGHGQNGEDPWVGSFDLGRDVGDMFGAPANNVLMLKVNYWLNP
ncbi:MAG: carbohydrate binding family 9 domain-containing protein [Gemmatimonadota bacterium]|nr:carbohydrate binding family 9 domain-containing protein [Gemmatimonadota bacterium]